MNKKFIIISILIIILCLQFSGCFENSKPLKKQSITNNNLPPIAVISAPSQAFYNEEIQFDASNSYDSDGNIVSYVWDFGDEKNTNGIKVNHSYIFENNFDLEFPVIYTINLLITDNENALTLVTHQIKIFPREFCFFLNDNVLASEKPVSGKNKISSLTYSLENVVTIKKCKWNATIYLEKPLFAIAKKLTITFYDDGGDKIVSKGESLGISILWKEKKVLINGEFSEIIEFKTLKLELSTFSIFPRVNIIYGGEKASNICFIF